MSATLLAKIWEFIEFDQGEVWVINMSSQNSAKRYDQQLAALIEGKNWKQALSLCEKRIKKGGQIEELLVRGNSLVASRATHSSKNYHRY